ncbi:gamma-glutamyl-gamma-aminobutyrate hydrolase family protein [Dactylosporangium roseum]|uniref:Gamma-glutamyl-gamma-aminobutyrate hydrolase family protein n=1 Tax=Dactylosporangium roseum TaxID=47989 RepID=A0ABY5ZB58_9ACTN|nr:gamma-glutamyl-gamma-aminobutyrate hydrolase family protein [Dactylosporangium roseum]UWZ38233.1 gamma-glutamyl-gamma-aminobutyrate hydrolase family protein [Dactylosporangium roseum]
MARPVIGLTTYAEETRFGLNDTFSAVLPLSYVHAVHSSGGRAVLVTPDDPDVDVLDGLDGIVFTGGSDVNPDLYGEPPHPTTKVKPERDAAELLLMRAALDADLPLFGICRGMQLMCVAYGGRLHQHLPDVLGHHNHRPVSGPKFGEHPVRLAPGSKAAAVLGAAVEVNSFHHQGIADPGKLTPTGWCPEDDLIEVVEDPAKTFTIGVQWHPEDTTDFRLFVAFVEAARTFRQNVAIRP